MFCHNSPPWLIHLGWPPNSMTQSFIELPNLWAMWTFWLASYACGFHSGIHGIIVLASFCLLDGVKRLVQASWWERLAVGNTGSWSDEQGPPQFSSVAQSCLTLCNPMDCSTPAFPVHHQLTEFTQTHAHWVSDFIQPSHPVIPFSSQLQYFKASGSFQMSQLFTSGGQSIGVSVTTSVLPMNIQDLSPLGWTGWISLQSKGLSRVFSNTIVQKHQFLGAQLSL